MTPRYIILVELISGEVFQAFTWTRDKASGIARAQRDAADFGLAGVVKSIIAQPIQ